MSRRSNKTNRKQADARTDQMKVKGSLNDKGWKNNPNYYFKDANQADVMSRIQMNAFGAVTPLAPLSSTTFQKYIPAICALYINPCPGVTPMDNKFQVSQFRVKGINRAAQKLWYILTAESGRSAPYTPAELSKLIGAEGELISTYEFIRRAFGISYGYSQRNRSMPTMLWQAMNIDPDDFRKNAAVYLKRMNSLMAVMNQLPIMGNIAYFSKCQDLYQNIFMDAASEMAQLWVPCPSTTWVLEEDDGFIGGSYLSTVDMCLIHEDTPSIAIADTVTNTRNVLQVSRNYRPLSDYIDIFEAQINALLYSSNFTTVYSDMLRAFDHGTLTRWSFDYIDEKYIVVPIYNESMLWQIHNATICRGWNTITKGDFDTNFDPSDYDTSFKYGTPRNDVYEWPIGNVVIYNPVLNSCPHIMGTIDSQLGGEIIDFPNETPTVEERIEFTRYMVAGLDDNYEDNMVPADAAAGSKAVVKFNFALPDHWIELAEHFFTESDASVFVSADARFYAAGSGINVVGTMVNNIPESKYHLFPTKAVVLNNNIGITTPNYLSGMYGEINSWAMMGAEWFNSINDMIYVDLFDIR